MGQAEKSAIFVQQLLEVLADYHYANLIMFYENKNKCHVFGQINKHIFQILIKRLEQEMCLM